MALTPRQVHVLLVLSTRGPSSAIDWAAWFPLDAGTQVRGLLMRLAMKGYVDVYGWERGSGGREARTFCITQDGHEALREHFGDEVPDEVPDDFYEDAR